MPKHGHEIVERNKVKRRLREIGRRSVLPALAGRNAAVDVLVRARGAAYGADFGTLESEVIGAVEEMCSEGS